MAKMKRLFLLRAVLFMAASCALFGIFFSHMITQRHLSSFLPTNMMYAIEQQKQRRTSSSLEYQYYSSKNDKTQHDSSFSTSSPRNLHKHYPLVCQENQGNTSWSVPSATLAWIEMTYEYKSGPPNDYDYYWSGHRAFSLDPLVPIESLLSTIQACLYTTLERWWDLSLENNITRWSAHGGTAMASYCHHAMNGWDDDVDITVASCKTINDLWDKGKNVSDVYPDIPEERYTNDVHVGRLIRKDLILLRGALAKKEREYMNYFKLKLVDQTRVVSGKDLSGIDIQCFDEFIPFNEKESMDRSNFKAFLKGDQELSVVPFGPTYIKVVPFDVLEEYVFYRYGKRSWCDFPYDKTNKKNITNSSRQHPRSSQMEEAVSKWYTAPKHREVWLEQVGKTSGDKLTKERVPNLNHVEVDNSISAASLCRIGATPQANNNANDGPTPLKVVAFNAERGTHWDKFADMVRTMKDLQKPDVIVLNEMDIGMARSGNVHTTRKLAYDLGMNYAWGLEFVELTRGSEEEQNRTVGMENSLGLHGNAILSTCEIYDPIIVRDDLADIYFSNKISWENADGYEKRLGGRMALFVRTGNNVSLSGDDATSLGDDGRRHIVVGSVHKLQHKHRIQLYKYFGAGTPPSDFQPTAQMLNGTGFDPDQLPKHQMGIIAAGDLQDRKFCGWYGLRNLDLEPMPLRKTFRSDCTNKDSPAGYRRGDFFCGTMEVAEQDKSIAPCYYSRNGTEMTQIADHAIIQIMLRPYHTESSTF